MATKTESTSKAKASVKNIIKIAIGELKRKRKKKPRKRVAKPKQEMTQTLGNLRNLASSAPPTNPNYYGIGRDVRDLQTQLTATKTGQDRGLAELERGLRAEQRNRENYVTGLATEMRRNVADLYDYSDVLYERTKRRGNLFATKPEIPPIPEDIKEVKKDREQRTASEPRRTPIKGGGLFGNIFNRGGGEQGAGVGVGAVGGGQVGGAGVVMKGAGIGHSPLRGQEPNVRTYLDGMSRQNLRQLYFTIVGTHAPPAQGDATIINKLLAEYRQGVADSIPPPVLEGEEKVPNP